MSHLKQRFGITAAQFNQWYRTAGDSLTMIAKRLGRDTEWLRQTVHLDGIQVKTRSEFMRDASTTGRSRKYSVNQGFFKDATPETAWVLGWIASDGNIATELGGWHIVSKDVDILDTIAGVVGYSGVATNKSSGDAKQLMVHSKEMVGDLLDLGLSVAKSLTLQYPLIPPDLDPYFIRGYFEGDGWIYLQKSHGCTNLLKGQVGLVTGSKAFAESLAEILDWHGMVPRLKVRAAGEVTFPSGITSMRAETYIIRLTGYSVARFYKFIYGDCVGNLCMPRKYRKFKAWFDNYGYAYGGEAKRLPTAFKAIIFPPAEEVMPCL